MPWIEPDDVTAVFPTDAPTQGLIDHVEGLAENEIGSQTEPVSNKLKAVMVQIVHRFSLASNDDDNIRQESIGSYSYTKAMQSGLGLTEREINKLHKAVGKTRLWTQPISRGDRLEVPYDPDGRTTMVDADFVDDTSGGDPIPWIATGDP